MSIPLYKMKLHPPSIVAIDFDGTCVTHAYPKIGCHIGAASAVRALMEAGHKIILWTMRSGHPLAEAVEWCALNGIELYGINNNRTQKHWTSSPKCYANLYIDDCGLGIPLLRMPAISDRPFVDWPAVEILLRKDGWLPPIFASAKQVRIRKAKG